MDVRASIVDDQQSSPARNFNFGRKWRPPLIRIPVRAMLTRDLIGGSAGFYTEKGKEIEMQVSALPRWVEGGAAPGRG